MTLHSPPLKEPETLAITVKMFVLVPMEDVHCWVLPERLSGCVSPWT